MSLQEHDPHKKASLVLIASILMLLIAVVLMTIILLENHQQKQASSPQTPKDIRFSQSVNEGHLNSAVLSYIDRQKGSWQQYDWTVDKIIFNKQQNEAVVWLAPVDKETGEVLGTEPRRAYAVQSIIFPSNWRITLEDDPIFFYKLSTSSFEDKDFAIYTPPEDQSEFTDTPQVYGGYYLPWAEGLTKRLTWSIDHSSCVPRELCTYAFDFADGTMFDLRSAKPGYVYHWKDTCVNGSTTCTNSITLEDRSTTPYTYQLYLHIAQNSVPEELKQVGTFVHQGQHIANVDDTGASSGHHVHFMVVTADTLYFSGNGYYFGYSVDITYRDVVINWDEGTQGGRPRLPYEADLYGGEGQTYYTSGNVYALEEFMPSDLVFGTLDENSSLGSLVGRFETTDPNPDDTHTYTLVDSASYPDNSVFQISGNHLETAQSIDYETQNSYTIKVRTTDSTDLFYEKTLLITVNNINEVPIAADKSLIVFRDQPLAFDLPSSDPDGEPLTAIIVSAPSHGTLNCQQLTCTYTPNLGYLGDDSITYKTSDGELQSNQAIISIKVGLGIFIPLILK